MVKLIDGGELSAALEREERLRSAVEWALGARGDFPPRKDGQGPYWWRAELQRRAGLIWDGEKFVDAPGTDEEESE